jgi:ATP-binding cassette subfamily F protein 3
LEKSKSTDARAALTAGFTDARPKQIEKASGSDHGKSSAAASPGTPEKKVSASHIRKFREEVGVLEKKVVDLEAKQAEITASLEAPETYADKGKFHSLNRELSTVVDQITTATSAWEKAASELAEMEK